MNREEEDLAKWLKRALPSAQETEMTSRRVFDRLLCLEAEGSQAPSSCRHGSDLGGQRRRVYLAVGTAAAIVAVLFGVNAYRHRVTTSVRSLDRIGTFGNSIGDAAPQFVLTDADRGALIPMSDGSLVEVHALSALTIKHGQDGMRLQLDRGSVIVTAAKQRGGHLYVRTRDTTVTVTGTIFFVGVEETGSRVGVIEGKVRVQQGGNLKTLEPGEQLSTNPAMPAVSIAEEIAWSQNAPLHLALLGQSVALQSPAANPPAPAPHGASVAAQAQSLSKMEFEAASVKRSQPGSLGGSTFEFLPGGGLRIINGTLRAILETAYDVREFQILGGPGWVNSDRFDILARSVSSASTAIGPPTNDVALLRLRLQTLLAQRFKLEVHGEARDLPEYALEVTKNRSKLVSDDATNASSRAGIERSCGKMVGTNTTMTNLTVYLTRQLDRPVLDRTSLTGKYSFLLQWTPDSGPCPGASDDSPSIFTALQEQLGLRLESIKGPVDSLIIDHAEQPSEN